MAKVMETIFRIVGQLDGSVMSAISRAQGALAGLNRSLTGRSSLGTLGDLSTKLKELQRAQAALERFKQMSRGGLIGGLDQIRAAQAEVQRLKASLSAARDAGQKTLAADLARQLKTAERGLRTAQSNFGSQTSELRSLYGALEAAGIKVRNLADAEQRLKAALSGANEALRLQEQFADAYRAHTDASDNISTAWGNMQSALTTAGGLMEPFKAATDKAETFEHAMSRVKSLTQSENIKRGDFARVREEMAELEEQARHLGATTQFTMLDAAQAQGFLGMAGWTKDQIIKAMPGMLDLAAASGMDLARTSDIVSDNLTALGMTADQVGHMTDVYAYALTRSNLNMEALGESMKYAAPAMHAYGGDIHDAAAAMMIMGNAGIKGSMAGTALRMGLLRLAGPPKKASKEMEALGVSLSDATRMAYESQAQLEALGIHVDAGMKPTEKMSFVLRELSAKMQGLSKDEKLAAVGAIFGVNAASGWLAVLEQGPEQFEKFRNALRESDGTAQQIAGTMNDDTRGSFLYLSSAVDALTTNVGGAFLPMMRSAYETLNPIVTAIADFAKENQGLVRALGGLAAVLSTAIVGLAAFRLALAGISFLQTTAGLARAAAAMGTFGRMGAALQAWGLTSTLRGIGLAVMQALSALRVFAFTPWGMALTGLATAAGLIYANWDKVGPYFSRLWSGIKSTFSSAATALQPYIDKIMEPFERQKELEMRATLKEELTEKVGGAINIKGEQMDEATRATRAILRQATGKSDEVIADEIWGRLSSEKQTDESQAALKGMLHEELSVLSEESRTAIETRINDRMYEAKVSTVESVRRTLEEATRDADLKTDVGRRSYLATTKEVLSGEETLSASDREQLFSEVKLQVEQAGAGYRLEETLSSALKGQATGTLTEQDEYVKKMLTTSATSGADRSTQLSVMERAIESLTELSESARSEMKEQVREGLQSSTDERIGSLVRDAVTRSTDESSAIAELKGVLLTQADKSAEALREMSVTVDRELKGSGRFEGEQIATILREVERGVKEATSTAAERKETWESVSTAVPEARRSAFEGVQIPQPWQAPAATQRIETPSYVGAGIWGVLSDLLFSKTEGAAAPSDQTLNIEPLQVSVDGTASAMTAFNGGLTSTLGATTSLTSSMTAAGSGAEALGLTSTAAQGGIEALSASSAGATSGVDGLSASSGGATGSIDGLGAAAGGAIEALMSAASSAGSAIATAASSAWSGLTSAVGSLLPGHAEGGIFPRGAHLTWFAEESAEAAIPLDNSKRSKGLWTKVGEMMGILPTVKETPQPTSIMSGSRVKLPFGLKIPSRRRTTPGVPPEVRAPKGKLPEALERYESIDREMRTYSSAAPSTTSVSEAMTAPITVNITFNGTVDREETKSGVMEGLEEALARLTHERSRRSYA